MIATVLVLIILGIVVRIFMQQAKFGQLPSGIRLENIKKSPNYRNGAFQNQNITPDLTEGSTYWSVGKEFFFGERKRRSPLGLLPSTKTDLLQLDKHQDLLVWFGHSSYFMQIDGKRILVDPVLSGVASPLAFTTRAFKGTDAYTPDDIPDIDYLFISHDHWDHVDHASLVKLKPKIGTVICGLGTGAHLERWGFAPERIEERDWNEHIQLDAGFTVHTVPARHFSGRGFKRNQALWTSYVLQTPTMRIFIGGDSGYDRHFAEIGEAFGPFDLVILENGQYDKSWKYIHMMPDEVLQAARDLKARRLFPVHSAKFSLANHAWDEPLVKITEFNKAVQMDIITPMIGERVELKGNGQVFKAWWEGVN